MVDYQVKLESFEGPLDLLLHLVRKNDLDIHHIPIAQITGEYLTYISMMRLLNLEITGEFLVMASTLMLIKSRLLLPRSDEEREEAEEMQEDLARRLEEYHRYKEAAVHLGRREEENRDLCYRGAITVDGGETELEASLFDLIAAFQKVSTRAAAVKEIEGEEIPIEVKIAELRAVMRAQAEVEFSSLFPPDSTRMALIVTFLALLELIRLKELVARQTKHLGRIRLLRGKGWEAAQRDIPETAPVSPVNGSEAAS